MIYYSNCKINIGLNIVDRYSDGYHALSTIFFPVNGLRDAIEIVETTGEIIFSSSGIEIDCDIDDNLCVKAYNILKENYDIAAVKIHLHKNIPIGAGLGGGSANAACVLMSLNDLFDLKITKQELKEFSKQLGSDVAFFIENRPMLGEGRGDLLSEIDLSLNGYYISIIKPSCSISTSDAYSMVTPKQPSFLLKNISDLDIDRWKDVVVNDFEKPMFLKHPILNDIKESLYERGALFAAMSGSGSSIFSISKKPIDFSSLDKVDFCYQELVTF